LARLLVFALYYILYLELKKNDALVVSLSVLGSSIERENILNDKALHLVFGAFLHARGQIA
jgi:hypothetical protein